MLTTLLFAALTLATAPDLAATRVAAAERNVAQAATAQRECWSPEECTVADQLVAASDAELAAARALAAPPPPRRRLTADYAEPFADLGPAEATEAQAAFDLAAVQSTFDALGQ